VDAALGSVLLEATDRTVFDNNVFGVSVGGSFADGASIAVAVAFAESNVALGGTVRARISDSDVDAGINVEQTAIADSSITSNGTGVASRCREPFSLAGAGAIGNNSISQVVEADILRPTRTTAGRAPAEPKG
jgi:hypothetical protein